MKFFCLAIILIFIAGCSNNSTVETKTDAPTNNSTAVNSMVAANETANANPNVQNETNAQSSNVKIRSGGVINKDNFDTLEQTRKGSANVAPIKNAALIKNAAPDNSEISSTMNGEGVPIETRTFKNNPLLLKTEKILADPMNPQMKIYLKNGKVVSLPASRISDSVNATANEILIAAGALPKNAPTENASKEKSKKSEN